MSVKNQMYACNIPVSQSQTDKEQRTSLGPYFDLSMSLGFIGSIIYVYKKKHEPVKDHASNYN